MSVSPSSVHLIFNGFVLTMICFYNIFFTIYPQIFITVLFQYFFQSLAPQTKSLIILNKIVIQHVAQNNHRHLAFVKKVSIIPFCSFWTPLHICKKRKTKTNFHIKGFPFSFFFGRTKKEFEQWLNKKNSKRWVGFYHYHQYFWLLYSCLFL